MTQSPTLIHEIVREHYAERIKNKFERLHYIH